MSSWNITASADLIKFMAQNATSSDKNNFAAKNSGGFSSDYAKILSQKISELENEFIDASKNNSALQNLNVVSEMPVIETIKRFRPDGSIMITTYKDGSIESTTKIKPHLVPMPDYSAPPTPEGQPEIKLVPHLNAAELLFL